MISFARSTSSTPGSCDEDLIAVLALLGDARLGDAQLVDAPLDRLPRLHDRLLAQLLLNVRLHA